MVEVESLPAPTALVAPQLMLQLAREVQGLQLEVRMAKMVDIILTSMQAQALIQRFNMKAVRLRLLEVVMVVQVIGHHH